MSYATEGALESVSPRTPRIDEVRQQLTVDVLGGRQSGAVELLDSRHGVSMVFLVLRLLLGVTRNGFPWDGRERKNAPKPASHQLVGTAELEPMHVIVRTDG